MKDVLQKKKSNAREKKLHAKKGVKIKLICIVMRLIIVKTVFPFN